MKTKSQGTKKSKIKKSANVSKEPSRKQRQTKCRQVIARVTRVVLCVSFISLFLVGATSVTRALTLEDIANTDGIPHVWGSVTAAQPDTITLPITYFDQRSDDCKGTNRQFEWVQCKVYSDAYQQGIVKTWLGADGLPVPSYTNANETRAAGFVETNRNVTGNDPVQISDNFYRWFHEVDGKSQRVDKEITFKRVGSGNSYQYGGTEIFPLEGNSFSDGDMSVDGHNFHFTAHLRVPIKVSTSGQERFDFSGDDDVWVFMNGRLILDIGGAHTALPGSFTINKDGTITSTVKDGKTATVDAGIQAGQVVNLDFFYAERSTTEANTLITISDMQWPISADSELEAEVVDNEAVEYTASLTNRDTINPLELTHLSSYLSDGADSSGFIPLSEESLYYTDTPEDESTWQPLDLSAPANTAEGFELTEPLTLKPSGDVGDTLYFRYYVTPEENTGDLDNIIGFKTYQNRSSGITFDTASVAFEDLDLPDPNDDTNPGTTDPDPVDDEEPGDDETDDTISDTGDDGYLAPLGEAIYVPQTGVITRAVSGFFAGDNFATIILSQGYILANLSVFAISFAVFFPLRRYL